MPCVGITPLPTSCYSTEEHGRQSVGCRQRPDGCWVLGHPCMLQHGQRPGLPRWSPAGLMAAAFDCPPIPFDGLGSCRLLCPPWGGEWPRARPTGSPHTAPRTRASAA